MEHVACIVDGEGHVTGLALEHFKLRRNSLAKTLRLKAYLLCFLVIAAIGTIVTCALLVR